MPATGTSTDRAGTSGRTVTTAAGRQVRELAAAHWYRVSTVADFKAVAQVAAGSTDLTSFWTSHRVEG